MSTVESHSDESETGDPPETGGSGRFLESVGAALQTETTGKLRRVPASSHRPISDPIHHFLQLHRSNRPTVHVAPQLAPLHLHFNLQMINRSERGHGQPNYHRSCSDVSGPPTTVRGDRGI